MPEELTPLQRQYRAVHNELPEGAVLLFRLGDFYEMFGSDATRAAPILGVTLTQRTGMPMCGVPYHAVESYLARLIRAGLTVGLCDQMEDPRLVKKGQIVRRELSRIITPGTITEDGILDANQNTYVAAVSKKGLALLDLSTGEFVVEAFASEEKLRDALGRYRPAELIVPRPDEGEEVPSFQGLKPTPVEAWTFSLDAAHEELVRHFAVTALDGFGLEGKGDLISAAGALLYYVHTTLHHPVETVRSVRVRSSDDFLALDAATIRHLALLPVDESTRTASLLSVLNATRTPMGSRLLANWIRQPLARVAAIHARLNAVEKFVQNRLVLSALQTQFASVRDLERLIAKVDSGRANARDLKALSASLHPVPAIQANLARLLPVDKTCSSTLMRMAGQLAPETEVVSLIDRAIIDEPNVLLTEGNLIADGYHPELDELRRIAHEGNRWVANYQADEILRTGLKTLRVRRNGAFGFYIELPKSAAQHVPEHYIRRQTLTNVERFTTPELKDYEQKVVGAQEHAYALEQDLFRDVLRHVSVRASSIQQTARAIGELDALISLADRALALGYVKPEVDDSDVLEITDGRHPIIEQLPDAEPFVPNSTGLNCTSNQIMLITGPNMAGKSTYIRQVATLAIMAQVGSFVPATHMRVGALDRVFTRVGAGDDLSRGRSTFLVEMQETANILNNATSRSLIVLDEIGRGTSTFDGISIAWSVAEYLHENPRVKAKTLFATHYHELAELAERFSGVKNYTVRVKQEGERIVFLRRIVPGVAEKSFGIHVAALAGLPQPVITRAEQILKNLEANELDVDAPKIVRKPRTRLSDAPGQMTFW